MQIWFVKEFLYILWKEILVFYLFFFLWLFYYHLQNLTTDFGISLTQADLYNDAEPYLEIISESFWGWKIRRGSQSGGPYRCAATRNATEMLGMDKGSTEERLILWNLFPPRVRVRPSRERVYLGAYLVRFTLLRSLLVNYRQHVHNGWLIVRPGHPKIRRVSQLKIFM